MPDLPGGKENPGSHQCVSGDRPRSEAPAYRSGLEGRRPADARPEGLRTPEGDTQAAEKDATPAGRRPAGRAIPIYIPANPTGNSEATLPLDRGALQELPENNGAAPTGRFAAWLAVQVMAHNLARWTARIGLGQRIVTTKTLRRRFFSLAGRLHPLGAPPHSASPPALALGNPVHLCPWHGCGPFHSRLDGDAGR